VTDQRAGPGKCLASLRASEHRPRGPVCPLGRAVSAADARQYRFAFIIGFIEKNDRDEDNLRRNPADRDASLRYPPPGRAPRRQIRLR